MNDLLRKCLHFLPIASIPAIIFILFYFPQKVPIHWNLSGEVTDWGSRYMSLIPPMIPALILVFFVISDKILPSQLERTFNFYLFLGIMFFCIFLSYLITILTWLDLNQQQYVSFTNIFCVLIALLIAYSGFLLLITPCEYLPTRMPWLSNVSHRKLLVIRNIWGVDLCISAAVLAVFSLFASPSLLNIMLIGFFFAITCIPIAASFIVRLSSAAPHK